jgi:hypothetical protein
MSDLDKAQEKGAEPQTHVFASQQELEEKIMSDRALSDEYLRYPDRFQVTESTGAPQGQTDSNAGTPQTPTPSGQGSAQPTATPEAATPATAGQQPTGGQAQAGLVEIKAQLPKEIVDELGYYMKPGRTVEEALGLALKGLREKDRHISFQGKRIKDAETESATLKQQVAELQARLTTQPAQPEKQPKASAPMTDITLDDDLPVNVDELPEDDTIFDAENTKKLVSVTKHLAKQNRVLAQELKATKQVVSAPRQPTQDETRQSAIDAEMRSIVGLQATNPEFVTPLPFEQLDAQVDMFYRNVAAAAGERDPRRVYAAAQAYFEDTDAGKALRERCEQNGIAPPDGLEQHQQIMAIRARRNEHRDRIKASMKAKTGKEWSDLDVEDLLPSYTELAGQIAPRTTQDDLLKARIDGANDARRSSAAALQVAREVPPTSGIPTMTLENVTEEQMSAILDKDFRKMTDVEANIAYEFYVANQLKPPEALKARLGK